MREASRIRALKDSNADLPDAKMTDFGRPDKATEYRQPAAFKPHNRAVASGLPTMWPAHVKTALPQADEAGMNE
jgi:hypothetical protein